MLLALHKKPKLLINFPAKATAPLRGNHPWRKQERARKKKYRKASTTVMGCSMETQQQVTATAPATFAGVPAETGRCPFTDGVTVTSSDYKLIMRQMRIWPRRTGVSVLPAGRRGTVGPLRKWQNIKNKKKGKKGASFIEKNMKGGSCVCPSNFSSSLINFSASNPPAIPHKHKSRRHLLPRVLPQ